jgi:formate hydrogenlyase subunit 3/multisubunit Na+/H+ antiporter MnhD subunit
LDCAVNIITVYVLEGGYKAMGTVFFAANYAFLCAALSLYFLEKKKYIVSIIIDLITTPLIVASAHYWLFALRHTGKNDAWLGFEEFPLTPIAYFIVEAASLIFVAVSIAKSLRSRGERADNR